MAKASPNRFFEDYIAEQNMVGTAMGLAARGKIPFAATFACFLTRAYDHIRMAAVSQSNIKLAGTHVGVSIGEDGPSQMGLEDLAMTCAQPGFTVFYPSDATSAWAATELAAKTIGPVYLRLGRPNNPILYSASESFEVGKCKTLRQSSQDQVLVVAGGVIITAQELAAITCSTLIMHGIRDRIVSVEYAHTLHACIADSRLLLFDAGHPAHIRCEEEYNAAILEFFA